MLLMVGIYLLLSVACYLWTEVNERNCDKV